MGIMEAGRRVASKAGPDSRTDAGPDRSDELALAAAKMTGAGCFVTTAAGGVLGVLLDSPVVFTGIGFGIGALMSCVVGAAMAITVFRERHGENAVDVDADRGWDGAVDAGADDVSPLAMLLTAPDDDDADKLRGRIADARDLMTDVDVMAAISGFLSTLDDARLAAKDDALLGGRLGSFMNQYGDLLTRTTLNWLDHERSGDGRDEKLHGSTIMAFNAARGVLGKALADAASSDAREKRVDAASVIRLAGMDGVDGVDASVDGGLVESMRGVAEENAAARDRARAEAAARYRAADDERRARNRAIGEALGERADPGEVALRAHSILEDVSGMRGLVPVAGAAVDAPGHNVSVAASVGLDVRTHVTGNRLSVRIGASRLAGADRPAGPLVDVTDHGSASGDAPASDAPILHDATEPGQGAGGTGPEPES